ncbi:hypothetical protein [Pseudomonas aeruginosa]|uniref:hypothetical protein n=1 Tax=Pseudomonas aeruginosa TaxID=287 RepID=UPI00193CD53E|nr:hypothetical protein [Pseudomonas aeruginosa]MBI8222867.1 hypothetical protein [Pseudomonas aeruginosa]MDP5708009.1 hypothetical protein [Pseudomonas aeruginosa]HBO0349191.1 hypothetical protein [Pseudomonas aeruginosa]
MTFCIGVDRTSFWLLAEIAAVLVLIELARSSFLFMAILVQAMALNLGAYCINLPLQARILRLMHRHRPQALNAGSGLQHC